MTNHHKNHWQWHSGHDHGANVAKIAQNLPFFGLLFDSTGIYTVMATAGVAQPDFGIVAISVVNNDLCNNNNQGEVVFGGNK